MFWWNLLYIMIGIEDQILGLGFKIVIFENKSNIETDMHSSFKRKLWLKKK